MSARKLKALHHNAALKAWETRRRNARKAKAKGRKPSKRAA